MRVRRHIIACRGFVEQVSGLMVSTAMVARCRRRKVRRSAPDRETLGSGDTTAFGGRPGVPQLIWRAQRMYTRDMQM